MENSKKLSALNVNLLISLGVWLVLILIHSFSIGGESNGTVPFFWQKPSLYLSTWCLDLLLIGSWYLNYYIFAPKLIARRKFVAYVVVVLLFMVLGLFFQLVLFYLFKWQMPIDGGTARASLFGCMAMLAVFTIGFSARSIKSWILLQERVRTLEKEKKMSEERMAELERQLTAKETPVETVEISPVESEEIPAQTITQLAEDIAKEDEEESLH